MRPVAAIVIPTYNESRTIGRLLDSLREVASDVAATWDLQIIVVDGASPDGTAEAVQEHRAGNPGLHLIREEKKGGIGTAYRAGFAHAVTILEAAVVLEFDGDLQHPPDIVPKMLAAVSSGADLVLGSRRIDGGGYPRGWSLWRRFLSQFGGSLTRAILFFPGRRWREITDPTTGLRATRISDGLRSLGWFGSESRGFGYKIETLHALVRSGVRVAEVPLKFQLRDAGESKITRQTPGEILTTAIRLRL
ncbi:MAG: glycosyltransferase, partial [Spirochaetales bacterium]